MCGSFALLCSVDCCFLFLVFCEEMIFYLNFSILTICATVISIFWNCRMQPIERVAESKKKGIACEQTCATCEQTLNYHSIGRFSVEATIERVAHFVRQLPLLRLQIARWHSRSKYAFPITNIQQCSCLLAATTTTSTRHINTTTIEYSNCA